MPDIKDVRVIREDLNIRSHPDCQATEYLPPAVDRIISPDTLALGFLCTIDNLYVVEYVKRKVGNPTYYRRNTMEAVKDYNVHLDSKKRITLRGALFQYYNVKEYENGCIMLEPRELRVPDTISSRTLKAMDKAIRNFKAGDVSAPIDLSDF